MHLGVRFSLRALMKYTISYANIPSEYITSNILDTLWVSSDSRGQVFTCDIDVRATKDLIPCLINQTESEFRVSLFDDDSDVKKSKPIASFAFLVSLENMFFSGSVNTNNPEKNKTNQEKLGGEMMGAMLSAQQAIVARAQKVSKKAKLKQPAMIPIGIPSEYIVGEEEEEERRKVIFASFLIKSTTVL